MMGPVLVVGATGQLGMAAVKCLLAEGRAVRAFVRDPGAAQRFQALGAETALGDLTQPATLTAACRGVAQVVATANAAIPSRSTDSFEAVEGQGYRNLIRAATEAGVRRFIYTSVPRSRYEGSSIFFRLKRETEQLIEASGLDHVIFRADIFMDISFAMMGSGIPLRSAEAASVLRPFAFARNHFEGIKDSIESKHVAMIPGDGSVRHAFICVDDVARFLAAAAGGGPRGSYTLGGPEALTFLDVVGVYEKVLGIQLRVKKTPALVFRILSKVMRPFNPAGANIMHLNFVGATEETLADPKTAAAFGVSPLTTAESFLRTRAGVSKAAMAGRT